MASADAAGTARRIDEKIDRITEDVRDVKIRVTSEESVAESVRSPV